MVDDQIDGSGASGYPPITTPATSTPPITASAM
jgi:hypothetical protein